MGRQEGHSVIHRKAADARKVFDARAMSPSRALRLSLARAADAVLDLAATVATLEQSVLAHGAIAREMGEDGLLLLLDGPDARRGALRFDTQFMAALVEVQTIGTVERAEAAPRNVTRTDAAIAAPLVDSMLERVDAFLAGRADRPDSAAPPGFRFGDMVEDLRTLTLALDAPDFDLFRVTVDLGEGAKTGVMTLLLPHEPAKRAATDVAQGGTTLRGNALGAPVVLDAVIARLSLPLRDVCALMPGTVLNLSRRSIDDTTLMAAGSHPVAPAQLGQTGGWRAVRLLGPSDPADEAGASRPAAQIGAGQAEAATEDPAQPAPVPALRES
ncbi:MAG: FliM/FliN family flagellar motor switch protein [Pseudomonadota bacterium]